MLSPEALQSILEATVDDLFGSSGSSDYEASAAGQKAAPPKVSPKATCEQEFGRAMDWDGADGSPRLLAEIRRYSHMKKAERSRKEKKTKLTEDQLTESDVANYAGAAAEQNA